MHEFNEWLQAKKKAGISLQNLNGGFHYQRSLPSTNLLAMEKLAAGSQEGTIVLTDHQTRGRGQQGTTWESADAENLTFSIILRPVHIEHRLFALSKMVALAVQDALSAACPNEEVLIKWPNDILLNRKKVAGILIENQWEGGRIKGTVAGIGLNVNQVSFSSDLANKATSIALSTGHSFERKQLLWQLVASLEKWYETLYELSVNVLDRQYLSVLYGYHEPVAIRWEGGEGSYPLLGVNDRGHIAVQLPGEIRHFDLKEIEFLLP
ncbi:MAG: biotin--[acetyl-CoA-carboxylase] ligase [Bacteroidia bacterium]|nr:biotin--[acetyl-CoA-carboxylase] ligase [Bacteroidia bacterium]